MQHTHLSIRLERQRMAARARCNLLGRSALRAEFRHDAAEIERVETRLKQLQPQYPQTDALLELHRIGLYSAMLITGELGDVERFRRAKQVAAYAGLTARVHQSGDHCYRGHISK